MKKSELRTGMLIGFKDESIRMVLLNTPYGDICKGLYDTSYLTIEESDPENLSDWQWGSGGVSKVYSPRSKESRLFTEGLRNYELIWENKPVETIKIGNNTYNKQEFENAVRNLKPL